jgi:hypothetical protein
MIPATVHAASSCPECGAQRPRMCRNADGTTRNIPHPSRRRLAAGVENDRLRESIGYRLHLRAGSSRTAWAAGRDWDREEAEHLRLWLRCYGSVLWQPPRTTGGTL